MTMNGMFVVLCLLVVVCSNVCAISCTTNRDCDGKLPYVLHGLCVHQTCAVADYEQDGNPRAAMTNCEVKLADGGTGRALRRVDCDGDASNGCETEVSSALAQCKNYFDCKPLNAICPIFSHRCFWSGKESHYNCLCPDTRSTRLFGYSCSCVASLDKTVCRQKCDQLCTTGVSNGRSCQIELNGAAVCRG